MTASTAGARTRRIAIAAVGIGIAAALGLAGCSSGLITQTASQVPPVPGTNANAGGIALRNLVIVYDDPAGYPAGGDAPLVVRLFNSGATPVTLVGVTADKAAAVTLVGPPVVVPPSQQPPPPSPSASASASASPTPGTTASPSAEPSQSPSPSPSPSPTPSTRPISIVIQPQSYILLVPGQGEGGHLVLSGLTEAITPGESTNVTFTFDDGSSATVPVPLAPPVHDVPRASAIVESGHAEASPE